MENDVIALPLARFAARIDERGGVAIKSASLAVEIGLVAVAIEHLNLVAALEIDAAVASSLTVAFHFGGRGPFDMQLNIRKLLLRHDAPGAVHRHESIFNLPLRLLAFFILPLRKILAVKEDDRIRRWRTGINDPGLCFLLTIRTKSTRREQRYPDWRCAPECAGGSPSPPWG